MSNILCRSCDLYVIQVDELKRELSAAQAKLHEDQRIIGEVMDRALTAEKRIAELERRQEIISCELQQKRLSMESCISHLAHIHSLLCPEGIRTVDKIYAFKPPVELVREAWEGLSQAIRDIPDAIDAARKEPNNAP